MLVLILRNYFYERDYKTSGKNVRETNINILLYIIVVDAKFDVLV